LTVVELEQSDWQSGDLSGKETREDTVAARRWSWSHGY